MNELQDFDHKQKEKSRKWYQKNKEKVNAKAKQYYQTNKKRIKKRSLEIVQCPLCNTTLKRGSLSHHKNNDKCKLQAVFFSMIAS